MPTNVNVRSLNSDRATMFVPGPGQVFNFTENDPTIQGAVNYGVVPSAFTVPNGTLVTFIIRTFAGNNQTGGEVYESAIVFACDTGVVASITNTAIAVPTMTEWTLALLALLLALAGGTVLYRRRTQV